MDLSSISDEELDSLITKEISKSSLSDAKNISKDRFKGLDTAVKVGLETAPSIAGSIIGTGLGTAAGIAAAPFTGGASALTIPALAKAGQTSMSAGGAAIGQILSDLYSNVATDDKYDMEEIARRAKNAAMWDAAASAVIPIAGKAFVKTVGAAKGGLFKLAKPVIESDIAKATIKRADERYRNISMMVEHGQSRIKDARIALDKLIQSRANKVELANDIIDAGIASAKKRKESLELASKAGIEDIKKSIELNKKTLEDGIRELTQKGSDVVSVIAEPLSNAVNLAETALKSSYGEIKKNYGDKLVNISSGLIDDMVTEIQKFKGKNIEDVDDIVDAITGGTAKEINGRMVVSAPTVKTLIDQSKNLTDLLRVLGTKGNSLLKERAQALKPYKEQLDKAIQDTLDAEKSGINISKLNSKYFDMKIAQSVFGSLPSVGEAAKKKIAKSTVKLETLFKQGENAEATLVNDIQSQIRVLRNTGVDSLVQEADKLESGIMELIETASKKVNYENAIKELGTSKYMPLNQELIDQATKEIEELGLRKESIGKKKISSVFEKKKEQLATEERALEKTKLSAKTQVFETEQRLTPKIQPGDWKTLLPVYMAGGVLSSPVVPLPREVKRGVQLATGLAFVSKWSPSSAKLGLDAIKGIENMSSGFMKKLSSNQQVLLKDTFRRLTALFGESTTEEAPSINSDILTTE